MASGTYVAAVSPIGTGFGDDRLVADTITRLSNIAAGYAEDAVNLAEDMSYVTPDPAPAPVYVVPTTLTVPDATTKDPVEIPAYVPETLDAFEVVPVDAYTPGTEPTEVADITLSFAAKPVVTKPIAPPHPVIATRFEPVADAVELPPVPTLRAIDIPEAPSVLAYTFSATNPSEYFPDLLEPEYVWEEPAYQTQISALAAKIVQYVGFDYDAAETAMWERGQERVDRSTTEAVLQITNDFASRGFSLPTGSMLAATNEARMKGAEAKYDNARDAMIKTAELNTQKLTLAIQSGIQYETMYMTYSNQVYQRQFEALRLAQDAFFKVIDAKVALYNSRVQTYVAEAEVYKTQIQAELTKLEAYKAELEGQKLIGELNAQDVSIYKIQLEAVMTSIEVYKAEVQAYVATLSGDKALIEMYASDVMAYKSLLEAGVAEYDAWGKEIQSEAAKTQAYESAVRAYSARVQSYVATEGLKIENVKLDLAAGTQALEAFRANIALLGQKSQAYIAEVQAKSSLSSQNIQQTTANNAAMFDSFKAAVQYASLTQDVHKTNSLLAMEHAHKSIIEAQENGRIAAMVSSEAAKVYSQLSASAMSAINVSQSAQTSNTLSNALQESYSASV